MKYNKAQIADALAEFVADTDGKGYLAMLTAAQAAPAHVDVSGPSKSYQVPTLDANGDPIPGQFHTEYGNKRNQEQWEALQPAEQQARIDNKVDRDFIFATQGALWITAQTEEIAHVVDTTVTPAELHNIIVPAERDALTAADRENLRDLYALGAGQIDISAGSSTRRDLDLLFTATGPGTTQRRLAQRIRAQTAPRHTVKGRPVPDIGLFERLVKGAS